jgi:putative sigma-54 modulation protein
MNVEFTGRNVMVTDDIRRFTEEKLSRLQRHAERLREVHVILTAEKHRQSCDIVARGGSLTLSAAEETDDIYTAIAHTVDKLARQARRRKTSRVARRRSRPKGADAPLPEIPEADAARAPEEIGPRVIPSDRFSLKPMTVEEAALQLQGIDDSFLVFRNAESEKVGVLYRRPDGNLGLIEPDL